MLRVASFRITNVNYSVLTISTLSIWNYIIRVSNKDYQCLLLILRLANSVSIPINVCMNKAPFN